MEENYSDSRQLRRNLPRRRVGYPQKLSCYKHWPSISSEDEEEEPNAFLSSKKRKTGQKWKEIPLYESTDVNENGLEIQALPGAFAEKERLTSTEIQQKENSQFKESQKPNSSNSFACSECGKIFRSKDTLFRHKISHTGSKPFPCDVCKLGFSSAVSLKEHKARHENKKLYECITCHGRFRQNSSYTRHLSTHSKTFPYICNICSRRFSQKAYLRSHMTIHTGEKRYSCNECTKSFAHLSDLNRHKVLHTGKRPYNCNICGSTFADRSSCRRHVKDHENKSQIYVCEQCNSTFKKAAQLKLHVAKKHSCSVVAAFVLPSQKSLEMASNDILQKTDNEVLQNTNSNSDKAPLNDSTTLHHADFVSMNKLQSEVATQNKTLPVNELVANGGFWEPNSSADNFSVAQAASSSVYREDRSFTFLPEINEAHCENIQGRFFVLEKEEVQKCSSNPNYGIQESRPHSSRIDYVTFPDFSSQDYYNWLSDFVSLCKLLTFPIESELFNKISQVHKSIADVLAEPSGLLCTKLNFKVLMTICQDLIRVTNGHLQFMYDQLQD